MSKNGKGARTRLPIPDSERCETVNVSKFEQKRCPKKAQATVTHPDLAKACRCCKTHAKDYTSAVQMATGWRVTWDAGAKGAE